MPRSRGARLLLIVLAALGGWFAARMVGIGGSTDATAPPTTSAAPIASTPAASGPRSKSDAGVAAAERRASPEQARAAIERLALHVKAGASDPKNPWALAHGIVAFGAEHRASDGRGALEVIASFADPAAPDVFPERRDEQPVEPHPDLLPKTLLESGMPLDARLKSAHGKLLTLRELLRITVGKASPPVDAARWRAAPWTLTALVLWGQREAHHPGPDAAAFGGAALARFDVELAATAGVDVERAKKEKLGFYAHPCGGMHFYEALLHWSQHEGGSGHDTARRIVQSLRKRWSAERELYARLLREHPDQGLILRSQQLKFFGHLLENLGLARQLQFPDAASEEGRSIDETAALAAGDLTTTLDELDAGGVWLRLPAIRTEREQTYLDLVGDGCHAIRGLRRTLARQ